MSDQHAFSVIIPAHNEEAVIARCLRRIRPGDHNNRTMQVIVVANGCSDRTVRAATDAMPSATVIDLAEGCKTSAINAGISAAAHPTVIVLDADVECDFTTLAALATAVEAEGVMTAAPGIRMDLSRSNWLVRAYYRAWLQQPYAMAGKGGAGCYCISAAGLRHIGSFPRVIGDDIWIHTRFADHQKRYVTQDEAGRPVFTTVHPPRTAIEQIRVEARRRIGNAEVTQFHANEHLGAADVQGWLSSAIKSGANPMDLAIFLGMKISARLLARWRVRRGHVSWSQDLTSRQS
jgi:glycosyltransferase involved in cell wall biosynthesis